jgi:hypothetical protein
MVKELEGKKVYVSFDMDGVDPAYAPGAGTMEADGLTAGQAMQLMRADQTRQRLELEVSNWGQSNIYLIRGLPRVPGLNLAPVTDPDHALVSRIW